MISGDNNFNDFPENGDGTSITSLPGGGTTTLGGGTAISGGTPDTGGGTPFRLNLITAGCSPVTCVLHAQAVTSHGGRKSSTAN